MDSGFNMLGQFQGDSSLGLGSFQGNSQPSFVQVGLRHGGAQPLAHSATQTQTTHGASAHLANGEVGKIQLVGFYKDFDSMDEGEKDELA